MPDPKRVTHILLHRRDRKTVELFRASDGVKIGESQPLIEPPKDRGGQPKFLGFMVQYGEDPAALTTRFLIDQEYAEKFLQHVAHQDDPSQRAEFEDREVGSRMISVVGGLR